MATTKEILVKLEIVSSDLFNKFGTDSYSERGYILDAIKHLKEIHEREQKAINEPQALPMLDVSSTVCHQCGSEELSRNPVTYDCHECGYTWQTGH